MRRKPLFLIALATVSALSATVALAHYSAAQSEPTKLRLERPEVKLIKPSRPARETRVERKGPTAPARETRIDRKRPTKPAQSFEARTKADQPNGGPTGFAGNQHALADLVVIPFYNNPHNLPEGFPEHSYCVKKPTGGTPTQIKFWIRNTGNSDTGGFQWHNSYYTAGVMPGGVIPNIPANSQTLITQNLPEGCYTQNYSGSCQFHISLDDHDEVEEQDEANSYSSYCVSPAG